MVTTVSEWRKKRKQGVEITLPNYGDVVSIRPMDVEFFMRTGRIPDFIAPVIRKVIGADVSYRMPEPPSDDEQKVKEWLEWLDELIVWTFVEPEVVHTEPKDNQLTVDEIDYDDKLFIYSLFGRPAQMLRRFRQRQVEPVATVDASKANGRVAVESPEYSENGESNPGDARPDYSAVVR